MYSPASRKVAVSAVGVFLSMACVTWVASVGCGGPPKARAGSDEKVPADGAAGGPAAASLPPKTIAREDWSKMAAEKLKPTCDARAGSRGTDAARLEAAGKIIGTWTEFSKKAKSGPKTADGKRLGGSTEPTRSVDSVGMTCSAEKNIVAVNGVQYPFDMAWVVAGEGTGPTTSGNESAGHFALIQALSFKDKRVIIAKVYVPSDANDDTDDTVVISNLSEYLPENADEPVVRAVSERSNPFLETFVFSKGATEGFSFQAPQQDSFGRARYLAVGRFAVAKQ
jgi:hypothetical protein